MTVPLAADTMPPTVLLPLAVPMTETFRISAFSAAPNRPALPLMLTAWPPPSKVPVNGASAEPIGVKSSGKTASAVSS